MRFAELTTLRVGGEALALVDLDDPATAVDTVLGIWADGDDWLVLGGGSNLLVGDDPVDATVIRMRMRGIDEVPGAPAGSVRLRVAAGEEWDAFVAHTVDRGLSGVEALAGIPGTVGASPVQNIGAYGQELAQTCVAVEFLDYLTGEVVQLGPDALAFGYRDSVFKRGREGVVLSVTFDLVDDGGAGSPVQYAQLAGALGVQVGDRVAGARIRDAVLELRRSKGMVLDPDDPDTTSAGSFFTNPVVPAISAASLPADAPRYPTAAVPPREDVAVPLGEQPAAPAPPVERTVKLSAAWLIEHAGIGRGFRLPGSRAAISSKHTLALTNTGGASAEEVAQLARYVQVRVLAEFGVELVPEPRFVGVTL